VLYDLRPRDVNQLVTKYLLLLVSRNWKRESTFLVLFLLILDQNSKNSAQYFIEADSIKKIYEGDGSKELFIPFNQWFAEKNLIHLDDRNKQDIAYIVSFLLEVKRGSLGQDFKEYSEFFNNTEQSKGSNTPHYLKWELKVKNEIDRFKMGFLGNDLLEGAIEYINFTEK